MLIDEAGQVIDVLVDFDPDVLGLVVRGELGDGDGFRHFGGFRRGSEGRYGEEYRAGSGLDCGSWAAAVEGG
jgi:hypothetical protein